MAKRDLEKEAAEQGITVAQLLEFEAAERSYQTDIEQATRERLAQEGTYWS